MNDLNKMRAEFEQKMKCAQMENEMNEKLKELGVRVSIHNSTYSTKKLRATFYGGESVMDELTLEKAGEVLNAFPVTEKTTISSTTRTIAEVDYKMVVHRSIHTPFTELTIDWISGEFFMYFRLKVDDFINIEDFRQHFKECERDATYDLSLSYQPAKSELRRLERFRYWTFAHGEVVKFSGGYDYQAMNYAGDLIDTLKYIGEFGITE